MSEPQGTEAEARDVSVHRLPESQDANVTALIAQLSSAMSTGPRGGLSVEELEREAERFRFVARVALLFEGHPRVMVAVRLADALHARLAADREVAVDELLEVERELLEVSGIAAAGRVRRFECEGCRRVFAVYRKPAARRCATCSEQIGRTRDRDRKRKTRAQATPAAFAPCSCGNAIEGRKRHYCSSACRQAAYRLRRSEGAQP